MCIEKVNKLMHRESQQMLYSMKYNRINYNRKIKNQTNDDKETVEHDAGASELLMLGPDPVEVDPGPGDWNKSPQLEISYFCYDFGLFE
ncbi:hypothetical protein Hanom_Chr06g00487681 [Helianthus anomalus]